MAAGRRSSDPTELLLVDPSQPEATKQDQKTSYKEAKRIFSSSMALLRLYSEK